MSRCLHNADEIEWDAVDKLEEEYAADAARIELLTDAGGLMRAWIGEGEKGITERWDSVSAPNVSGEQPAVGTAHQKHD